MYESLTAFIDKLKEDSVGEWIVDKENDGTPEHPIQMPFVAYSKVVTQFEKEVYSLKETHPELELNQYSLILERNDIKWQKQSMATADVSKMDGQGVMALIMAAVRAERFCDGALKGFFENGAIEKWLLRLKEIDENDGEKKFERLAMDEKDKGSKIELINGSCADQIVDVIVNAANSRLLAGGGICGVIFKKAGMTELTKACNKYNTPLNDGDAVITPAFNLKNAKAIIHAVGPNFGNKPTAFKELFDAYYNSLMTLMNYGYCSISFPLISAGIFGGSLDHPVAESTKQCCSAYKKFTENYPMYAVDVKLCAFTANEMLEARQEFEMQF